MAKVLLQDVCKIYPPDVMAVNHVNLQVQDREFLVLVGPSGCGKSTTLRMVAGLEEISSGDVYINGDRVNDMPPKDRDIAMVFQNYALYPHMTVYENMAFGLKLRRYPAREIEQRVRDAAEILGLKAVLQRKPRALSGGERQRVAVGRAIVRKPKVFLFDEPLSNLDAKLRVQMRTEIEKLHLRLQATMMYVTHDQVEAMTMGDRIAVMKDGLVQQVADPLALYNKPINKFVAGFIGSPPMNFITGRLIQKERRLYFDEGRFHIRLVDTMVDRLASYDGHPIVLGIRPEDIYDRLFVPDASAEQTVKATVEVAEPLGAEVYLYLTTGRNNFIARMNSFERAGENQEMDLVFDMSKAHFFDPQTEKSLG